MSLIAVRRRRKKHWLDTRKGMNARKLSVLLVLVLGIIWYLGWAF